MSAQRATFARLRHPMAAVLGVAGILVGSIAAFGTPSASAAGELVATTKFTCTMSTFPAYDWDSQVTLSAVRPAGSTTVTVSATMSEMKGVAPVRMNGFAFTDSLALTLGGKAVTLSGTGTVTNSGPSLPFAMPSLRGEFESTAADVAAVVTKFDFSVTAFALNGSCTPLTGANLGTLTIVEGAAPSATPVTPTPTTTTSATATPTPSSSPTATATSKTGKAAKGEVAFACTMSIGSTFDYNAKMTVSGYRAKKGSDVSLVATMSDLPGESPVLIDGPMDFTLDLKVGGKKVTLKSTGDVRAEAKQVVPVTDLTGTVAADDDELAISASAFSFNFPSAGIGANCKAASGSLGTMKVGSEPIDTDSGSNSTTGGTTTGTTTGTSTGTSTLPKTGGGDSMPVVALWALALTLLGVAGLLCVPRTRRQH